MSLSSEAVAMGASALWVAAAALPVGGACAWLARRWREPIVPGFRKTFARWDGFDAFFLFVVCIYFPLALAELLDGNGVFRSILGDVSSEEARRPERLYRRGTLARLLLAPAVMVAFHFWKKLDREHVPPARDRLRRFVANVATGIGAWVVLTPITLAVHFLVNVVCEQLDIPPQDHPLKSMKVQSTLDVLLLFAGACVTAPFYEEMAFRRVLVPWASRSPQRSKVWPWLVGWPYRAWILMLFAAVFAFSRGSDFLIGAIVFVGLCAAALAALARVAPRWRLPPRPTGAIFATAMFFAAVHANVWPTPIPLLVLGLGLGWVVHRTKTVTAAVVAHGLFNAVSAVFLVRSAP